MPSSDYSNAVGGGLKLKGAGGGVEKKKKKKKSSSSKKPAEGDSNGAQEAGEQDSALQKALAEEVEDQKEKDPGDAEVKEYGKTEAQRRFEERRKKRVSQSPCD